MTVSVVSGGLGAAPVSMVFAASAKTGATMALSAGAFSSIFSGTLTAITTGDVDEALKAAALGGSESFKWAAIAGALIGGASEASALYAASSSSSVTAVSQNIPEWRQAELRALDRYGGREQISYLNGVEVPKGTPGATRPDILCDVGGHLEAIEVKYFDLSKTANLDVMYSELEREIAARVVNLPAGTTQKIVLDVTGRGFPEEMVNAVAEIVQGKLYGIYPNIPVEIWGL